MHSIGTAAVGARSGALPIRFEGVAYRANETSILERIDLEIRAGGPTVMMGPNGSGKTTLIRLAMGLVEPATGRITFAGASTAAPGTRSIVFQKPVMLRRTTADNVAFALSAAGRRSVMPRCLRSCYCRSRSHCRCRYHFRCRCRFRCHCRFPRPEHCTPRASSLSPCTWAAPPAPVSTLR
jgi:ABC-type multidrug transport system fused ATPase/permease subunit